MFPGVTLKSVIFRFSSIIYLLTILRRLLSKRHIPKMSRHFTNLFISPIVSVRPSLLFFLKQGITSSIWFTNQVSQCVKWISMERVLNMIANNRTRKITLNSHMFLASLQLHSFAQFDRSSVSVLSDDRYQMRDNYETLACY